MLPISSCIKESFSFKIKNEQVSVNFSSTLRPIFHQNVEQLIRFREEYYFSSIRPIRAIKMKIDIGTYSATDEVQLNENESKSTYREDN